MGPYKQKPWSRVIPAISSAFCRSIYMKVTILQVLDDSTLLIPDYIGNNMFQSLGESFYCRVLDGYHLRKRLATPISVALSIIAVWLRHTSFCPVTLRFPIIAGAGNIVKNPAAGVQFVDFASGDSLQLTGRAEIIFDEKRLPGKICCLLL